MENQAWARVTAELEKRREGDERENDRRRQEIAEKYPDLERLLVKRHEMVMGSVRFSFAGSEAADPEQAMREYNEKIADRLSAYGYPRDYLTPVCQCPLCGDTGYVYENAIQKRCACALALYQKALTQEDPGGQEPSFARFDPARFPDTALPGADVTQREWMLAVRDKCLQYARSAGTGEKKTLLLHGGSGLGKTFLLRCVEEEARSRGVDCLFVTAYDLLVSLKNAFFSGGKDSAEMYFDAPLLLIDDLGMEPLMENITVEQIYNLLNARLSRGLYTALTTNLTLDELKRRYTERVASRLLDTRIGMALHFVGRDIRLLKSEELIVIQRSAER